ncbi:site-specific DNA-methyltransferase [Paenibacillus oralis]|uniref:Site-specific DNA-methyltransferase n=1 Tax=Paenibacillus oralis TaxID=2490856 RepID=A0A3P3T9D9_9BACL|nr:DNA methyltransferase [Paenibacillus oralis]RRJ54637.1 site-specific DNA-methyltransferase [Paenibacillus oralis]
MKQEILAKRIADVIQQNGRPMHIKEIATYFPDKPESTIRGRLYTNLKKRFERVSRGVYMLLSEDGAAFVVEGDGRNLSAFEDESVDAIVTDHPWKDEVSNKGTNRVFDKTYDHTSFLYTIEDFKEKARVLREGAFLVEILPAENENNWKYLFKIKAMAEAVGLNYYAKVPWKKGKCVYNTGRKSKNSEDIMFFVKGKARPLRPDKQRGGWMSGTSYMLPTEFDFEPIPPKKRIHQAEKPVELYEAILEAITLPGEVVVDQFAGSGNLGRATMRKGRIAVLFEILKKNVSRMIQNLSIPELTLQV